MVARLWESDHAAQVPPIFSAPLEREPNLRGSRLPSSFSRGLRKTAMRLWGLIMGSAQTGSAPFFMYKSAAVHVSFMPYFRALKQPKPSKLCCHMLFKLLKQHVAAYFRWSGRASWRGTPSSGKYVRSAERPSQRKAGVRSVRICYEQHLRDRAREQEAPRSVGLSLSSSFKILLNRLSGLGLSERLGSARYC